MFRERGLKRTDDDRTFNCCEYGFPKQRNILERLPPVIDILTILLL